MSKADEIFKKAGFEKKNMTDLKGNIWGVAYEKNKEYYGIYFDFVDKNICVIETGDSREAVYFTLEDLKLINEKVKELGWVDR